MLCFVACWLLYSFAHAAMEAYAEVRVTPRVPMFKCDKHGMMRQEHAMDISSLGEPLLMCPLCYDSRMQGVRKILKGALNGTGKDSVPHA